MARMNSVASSAIARSLSFIPIALATLVTSRLIIRDFGLDSFNSFALIVSLIALIPLNNLGVGAAVTSAYASGGPRSEHSQRVTLTAARVLTVSSAGTAAAALLITAFDGWPTLLGSASGPNLYCGIAMAVFALSFLPGLGQSMLLGVHRNHATVIAQTFITPLILIGTVVIIVANLSGSYLMVVPPAALVLVNVLLCVFAFRATGISWRYLLAGLLSRRRHPGASIRSMSGPMLIITLAVPLSLQSDRIVLSHVSTAQEVAKYSVAIQIFGPVVALVAASAQPLWPIYARARSQGRSGPKLGRVLAVFCGGAAVVCALLVLVSNPIGVAIAGNRIDLGWLLPVAAALSVVTQAAAYPLSMSLMDPPGVRFIGICTMIGLPLNIALSIVLGQRWGAPGPLLATFAVGLIVATLPALLYSRGRQNVGRHRRIPARDREWFTASVAMPDGMPVALEEPPSAESGDMMRA